MITGKNSYGNSLSQKYANTSGKISTQLMSENLKNESSSEKKALEESVKMEGYEISDRKPTKNCPDLQQSIAKCSEFWIG